MLPSTHSTILITILPFGWPSSKCLCANLSYPSSDVAWEFRGQRLPACTCIFKHTACCVAGHQRPQQHQNCLCVRHSVVEPHDAFMHMLCTARCHVTIDSTLSCCQHRTQNCSRHHLHDQCQCVPCLVQRVDAVDGNAQLAFPVQPGDAGHVGTAGRDCHRIVLGPRYVAQTQPVRQENMHSCLKSTVSRPLLCAQR